MIELLNDHEIILAKQAGLAAASTLQKLNSIIKPGVTTQDIDDFVRDDCIAQGCSAAPYLYRGSSGTMPPFPGYCCTSINNVVCHGIPGPQVLRDGDIINVDVTHIFRGFHGDTSATFCVGQVSDDVAKLVQVCKEALKIGIEQVKPGARFGDIGAAIEEFVDGRYSIVTDYVGHGVGRKFHMPPVIYHTGKRGTGQRMKAGMCFTIEPMLNMGTKETILLEDGWTVLTADGKLSAQCEHTILVTELGYEILTRDND